MEKQFKKSSKLVQDIRVIQDFLSRKENEHIWTERAIEILAKEGKLLTISKEDVKQ